MLNKFETFILILLAFAIGAYCGVAYNFNREPRQICIRVESDHSVPALTAHQDILMPEADILIKVEKF